MARRKLSLIGAGEILDSVIPPVVDGLLKKEVGDCIVCDSDTQQDRNSIQPLRRRVRLPGRKGNIGSERISREKVTLTFKRKSETVIFTDVTHGHRFTLSGAFSSRLGVLIEESENEDEDVIVDCEFHTSCSVPIVIGDLIGPFHIVGIPQSTLIHLCREVVTHPEALSPLANRLEAFNHPCLLVSLL